MKTYVLNLEFNSHAECEKWEKENLYVNGRQMYNGEYILMVCHEQKAGDDKIILTEIMTV